MMVTMMLTYTELVSLPTFEERFRYLKLDGSVGQETFGYDRWINQQFYHQDKDWKKARNQAIIRDNGCDLAHPDRPIPKGYRILVHHLNPITAKDIQARSPKLFDLENLVCTIEPTHNAIHYGDENLLVPSNPTIREPNDTCPWR